MKWEGGRSVDYELDPVVKATVVGFDAGGLVGAMLVGVPVFPDCVKGGVEAAREFGCPFVAVKMTVVCFAVTVLFLFPLC